MLYRSIKHTDKPLQGSCDTGIKATQQLDMVEISMGQKGFLDTHHCISVSCKWKEILANSPDMMIDPELDKMLQDYLRIAGQ